MRPLCRPPTCGSRPSTPASPPAPNSPLYRGTNPYLDAQWDPELAALPAGAPRIATRRRLGLLRGRRSRRSARYRRGVAAGDLVWGIWGHRRTPSCPPTGHRTRPPAGLDPLVGTFARVGAVALNAVLASDPIGETVAVFGQGVIGLLATQLLVSSRLSGARRRRHAGSARARQRSARHHCRALDGDLR